jgi:hypothetical protein
MNDRISFRAMKKSNGSILPVNGNGKMYLREFLSSIADGEIFCVAMEKNVEERCSDRHLGYAMLIIDRIAKADGVPKTIKLDQLMVDFGISFIGGSVPVARKGKYVQPYQNGDVWFIVDLVEYSTREMYEFIKQMKLYCYEGQIEIEDLEE